AIPRLCARGARRHRHPGRLDPCPARSRPAPGDVPRRAGASPATFAGASSGHPRSHLPASLKSAFTLFPTGGPTPPQFPTNLRTPQAGLRSVGPIYLDVGEVDGAVEAGV